MIEELEQFLAERNLGAYERDAYDKYCQKRSLSLDAPAIHITGSNGKGSTLHYLESIYLSAGYHVGAFIKPAFYALNECIRVDGKEISDDELRALFKENRKDFEKFKLSEFECSVAMAYRYFNSKKLDIVLVEAGMGGLVDATNIEDMDVRLSIITTVSLEHTAYLGTTVSAIALHKAGIIKEETPVLTGKLDEDSDKIILEQALAFSAPYHKVDAYHFDHLDKEGYHFDYGPYKNVILQTSARYQLANAALAIEAVNILQNDFPVNEEAIRKGLSTKPLPGRLESFGRIVIDGAHNPEGINSLSNCIATLAGGRPVYALFASFRDKNIAVELPRLANSVTAITLTTFPHPRARTEEDYFLYAQDHPFMEDAEAALDSLLSEHEDALIIVTGSLAFAGYMRKIIIEKRKGI